MKFIRLDLLTLLISLFILGSCKNQDTVGLPLGNQEINGTLAVYDNITVNTERDDTLSTTGLSKTPLSAFNDPVLGLTEANIATAISLPGGVAYTVPAGTITTDSVVLEMRYADGFYGDSLSSNYKVNVHQLSETPLSGINYYNNKTWSYNTLSAIGSRNFFSRTRTPVKTFNIIAGKPDTLVTRAPQLRIRLNNSFIQNNLWGAATAQLASNTAFQNSVKGLFIKLDRSQTTGPGGTFFFNLDSSRIHVYYRVTNGTTIDTSRIELPLSTRAAEIKHTTYPTAVQAAIDNKTTSNSTFYLQGLAGLRARIAFPTLKSIFGTADVSKIALNRAELVITPEPGSGIPYAPSPQLTMYRWNIAHQRQSLPDGNGSVTNGPLDARFFSPSIFGGFYNSDMQYRFVITGYIQDLLSGRLVDYGTFIAPIDVTGAQNAISIAPDAQSGTRLIGAGNQPTAYRIKLNIIYTKPQQ